MRDLDGRLRRAERITEYTSDPRCVLRLARISIPCDIRLQDGTDLRQGEPAIDLHFWNEHLRCDRREEGTIGWSARLRSDILYSLRTLAAHLATSAELSEARAICARLALSARADTQRRFGERMGFEEIRFSQVGLGRRCHDALENVWLVALGWTFNPCARPRLLRAHTELWMSRSRFLDRYGSARTRPLA